MGMFNIIVLNNYFILSGFQFQKINYYYFKILKDSLFSLHKILFFEKKKIIKSFNIFENNNITSNQTCHGTTVVCRRGTPIDGQNFKVISWVYLAIRPSKWVFGCNCNVETMQRGCGLN
jgi:hypothetical protein